MKTNALNEAIHIITTRTGLAVDTLLRQMMDGWTQRIDDIPAWTDALATQPLDAPVWQALFTALTIGETYFMRDVLHFQLLHECILPDHIAHAKTKKLRLLCLGCATGEEAYSLAMTLQERLPDPAQWQIELVAVDLNAQALAVAERATYRMWSLRQSDEGFRQRYFVQNADDTYTLRESIRQMVRFYQGNLLELAFDAPFDVIFCRHVLLYFDKTTIEHAERRLYSLLRPQGWLILGQAEAIRATRDLWTMHIYPAAPLYQRPRHRDKTTLRYARFAQSPATPMQHLTPVPQDYEGIINALRQHETDGVEQHLVHLLAQFPQDARTRTLLGYVFANRKAYPEAEAQLSVALQHAPLYADAHYIRAALYNEQGEQNKAAEALQATIYCDREHELGLLLYGLHWQQRGDGNKARHFWERARNVARTHPEEAFVSDYSDLTHGELIALIKRYLGELQ